MKKPFIYLSAVLTLSLTVTSTLAQTVPQPVVAVTESDSVIHAQSEQVPVMGSAAMAASIQEIVSSAPALSNNMLEALRHHEDLKLTTEQQAAIEKVLLSNAQSLQIVLEGFRANLITLMEKIKVDIYPILTPRQQAVMKHVELVQKAELDLLKAKVELNQLLQNKLDN